MASSQAFASSLIGGSAAAEAAFRTANAAASILALSKPDGSPSALPVPDLLLRHLDRAIAAAESAQASYLLSASPSSPSLYTSNLSPFPVFSQRAVETKNGSHARLCFEPEEMAQDFSTCFSEMTISETDGAATIHDVLSERSDKVSLPSEDNVLVKSRDERVATSIMSGHYDPRMADAAYRAGNSALAEGDFQTSLKFLHLALYKCPPDKVSAVVKIRRVISLAVQQLRNTQRLKNQELS